MWYTVTWNVAKGIRERYLMNNKHFAGGFVGLPSGVTLVQAHKTLSEVFCSLNKVG